MSDVICPMCDGSGRVPAALEVADPDREARIEARRVQARERLGARVAELQAFMASAPAPGTVPDDPP